MLVCITLAGQGVGINKIQYHTLIGAEAPFLA